MTETRKTHLLFIFTDQQRADTLTACGSSSVIMPNLDQLAEQSCVFRKAYVTQPICTPSRASIMTGLYPHSNGCTENNIPLAEQIPTLAEMLPAGQWITAYYGKWHLGDEIFRQHGFDHWAGIEDQYDKYYSSERNQESRSAYHHFLVEHGIQPQNGSRFGRVETVRLREELSKAEFLAQKSCEFIQEHRKRPFVLYVNFLDPHPPYTSPLDDLYQSKNVELPANFDDICGPERHLKKRMMREHYRVHGGEGAEDLQLDSEESWQTLTARYRGQCTLVDRAVGKILDALKHAGLFEDTIIVFTSDHGDQMGSHGILEKGVMCEESARVPQLLKLPGQEKQTLIDQPVSQVDLVPTLLEALEVPVPSALEGKSLYGSLAEGSTIPAEDVFIEWNEETGLEHSAWFQKCLAACEGFAPEADLYQAHSDRIRTIITPDGWKFSYSACGMHELFNLYDDPLETENLFPRQEHQTLIHELTERIIQWQQKTNDPDRFVEVIKPYG